MDLGSLELQIFVSLTVVLGGAFVALVCDYLKGNNEQLREHNIELRVRKEEQERRLFLDPAGFLGQWLPGSKAASQPAVQAERDHHGRTVSPHEVMQSFAAPDALMEAESRAAKFHARSGNESFDSANVPPLTQRRNGRIRTARKNTRDNRNNGESYADWVRPEVIARIARKSEAAAAYGSDIRDELESTREPARTEPLHAAENWDIRDQVPARHKQSNSPVEKASADPARAPVSASVETHSKAEPEKEAVAVETRMNPAEASGLQQEIERVSHLDRQPLLPAPGTIMRPLTVPSLRLQDEIERVSEHPPANVAIAAMWHSPLLDEVIAASAARARPSAKRALFESAARPAVELGTAIEAASVVEALPIGEFASEVGTEPVTVAAELAETSREAGPLAGSPDDWKTAEPSFVELKSSSSEAMNTSVAVPAPNEDPLSFTFAIEPEHRLLAAETPVAVPEMVTQSEGFVAGEAAPFSFVMDEEPAMPAAGTPVVLDELVFQYEVVEAGEPAPFTLVVGGEYAPFAAERAVEAVEADEPPPFAFFVDAEPTRLAAEAPVALEESISRSEAIDVAEVLAFPYTVDVESAPLAVEAPVVLEESISRSEAIDIAETLAFPYMVDVESAPLAVEAPVVLEESISRSEAIDIAETLAFPYMVDVESAPLAVEAPVVLEESISRSEAIDIAETLAFPLTVDVESAPLAVEAPVALEESISRSEAIDIVETLAFPYMVDVESAPLAVEAPIAWEEIVSQTKAIEIAETSAHPLAVEAEPVKLGAVAQVVLAETDSKLQTNRVEEPSAYPLLFDSELDPMAAQKPVAIGGTVPQREALAAAEALPITLVKAEAVAPLFLEAEVFEREAVEAVEPPPFPSVLVAELRPAPADKHVGSEETALPNEEFEAAEPPIFTFVMDVESAPPITEPKVSLDGPVSPREAVEAEEPAPFTFVGDVESMLLAGPSLIALEEMVSPREAVVTIELPTILSVIEAEPEFHTAEAPVASLERVSRVKAVNAVEPAPLTFVLDAESTPPAAETPVVLDVEVAGGEEIEPDEPAPFTFVLDVESTPLTAETHFVSEEIVSGSDPVDAVEPPPFPSIPDVELAMQAAETPVAISETAGCVQRTAELPVVGGDAVSASEASETVEPPPFPSVIKAGPALHGIDLPVALDESVSHINEVETEATSPFTFVADVESAPLAAETPAIVGEIAVQCEAINAVEPPPFVFDLNEDLTQGTEDASPAFGMIASPDAEHTFVPPPFPLILAEDSESVTVPEPVKAAAPPVETETTSIWLESPAAVHGIDDAEPIPAASIFDYYLFGPQAQSGMAGRGASANLSFLPALPAIEKPASSLPLSEEPALAHHGPSMLAESDPKSLTGVAAAQFAFEKAIAEPPPFWTAPAPALLEFASASTQLSPIDRSAARSAQIPPAPVAATPDLLLPTGMHDISTWTRLLSLPNPISGILFIVTLQPSENGAAPERKGAPALSDNGPAVEKLMASFVREGDFGTRIAENEWVFIYNHDVAGFNQRRVGMISEKLWDFQLRHLGTANVSFKWGAIDVKSEGLADSLQAARDRMNQTRRARKLPGADQASQRRAVNA